MINDKSTVDLQIDVGVLTEKVSTLTILCNKMDSVIEKLMEKQEEMESDIYDHVEKKRQETVNDIKDIHSRITNVDRNLSDKLELTERRIMDEIKSLRQEITDHNKKEDSEIQKILQWKWMAAGGIIVVAWLLSHIRFDTIAKILNG